MRVKLRRRGCADGQMLLSLIYSFCAGGHLSNVDSLGSDPAALRITGLKRVPDSRLLGSTWRMSPLPLATSHHGNYPCQLPKFHDSFNSGPVIAHPYPAAT